MLKTKYSVEVYIVLIMLFYFSFSVLEAKEVKAKLHWYNITELSFRVSGIVSVVEVSAGDIVKPQQPLLNLDQREFKDNVKQSKSLHLSRKSDFDEAKRELERAEELFERTVLSEHELQTIKNKFVISESNNISANIAWLKAKRELEYSNIISPFDAIVLDVAVNESETINSFFKTTPVIILAAADKMAAHFSVGVEQIKKLKSGTVVTVNVDGVSYKGSLFFPSLQSRKGLYSVAVLISVSRGTVFSGMAAIVEIP